MGPQPGALTSRNYVLAKLFSCDHRIGSEPEEVHAVHQSTRLIQSTAVYLIHHTYHVRPATIYMTFPVTLPLRMIYFLQTT